MGNFKFYCIRCGQQLVVDSGAAGQSVTCSACSAIVTVPFRVAVPQLALPGNADLAVGKQAMAITSLVLGILSLTCLGPLAGILAIILGHLARSAANKDPGAYSGKGKAAAGFVMGYGSIVAVLLLLPAYFRILDREASIRCQNNMKLIGLSLRTWALDNGDAFPFNVKSKDGGSKESCEPDGGGFDKNSFRHFLVMSNELSTPRVLLCPSDKSKTPAFDFPHLAATNVTYLLRVGEDINDFHPDEILLRCPIHGNVILCDGSVLSSVAAKQNGKEHRGSKASPAVEVKPDRQPSDLNAQAHQDSSQAALETKAKVVKGAELNDQQNQVNVRFARLPSDLEKTFQIDDDSYRKSQIASLDDSLFTKARETPKLSFVCAVEHEEFLKLLSNSNDKTIAKVARLRLSLNDPLVKERCGTVQLRCEWQERSANYQLTRPRENTAAGRAIHEIFPGSGERVGEPTPVPGEFVSLTVERNGTVIASGSWETEFPSTTWGGLINAKIDTGPLLSRLLAGRLQKNEIELLLESKRPELRQAGVILMDTRKAEAVLNGIALKDPEEFVRKEATKRVADQTVLARIVIDCNSSTQETVEEAMRRLTSQDSLAWAALNSDAAYTVGEAIKKLTDQELLAKIAIELNGEYREYDAEEALGKLTDKSLIKRVATEARYAKVKEKASQMLER